MTKPPPTGPDVDGVRADCEAAVVITATHMDAIRAAVMGAREFRPDDGRVGEVYKRAVPFRLAGQPPVPPGGGDADPPDGAGIPPGGLSEDALALRFAHRHAGDCGFVGLHNRWYIWDGVRWQHDATRRTLEWARQLCRDAVPEAEKAAVADRLTTAKTASAILFLATADRKLAFTADQFDANPDILNTPAGIVDLRSGRITPCRPDAYCTRSTAVSPDGREDCPTWRDFLDTVTGGNLDLECYLRRLAGYALTGHTREHMLAFLHGPGGNGKGTFLNTLTATLGTYATVAPMDTFAASSGDRHPTELAALQGARLVTAQETENGRRWAEARIKALTGGDPISARFMRGDFFTFQPAFKLVMSGNHRPGLRNVDDAIRRRMHLVPFTVKIPRERVDLQLAEKLAQERPGILQWAIRGAVEWYGSGLNPPALVRDATAEYLESEDVLGRWIEECCTVRPTMWASSTSLYQSWSNWAEAAGEKPGSRKAFAEALHQRGFQQRRTHGGHRGFDGICPAT